MKRNFVCLFLIVRFLQTNNFLNNVISLPSHADGTCDYEDEILKNRRF